MGLIDPMLFLLACTPSETAEVAIFAPEASGMGVFLSTVGDPRIVVTEDADPASAAARSAAPVAVSVTVDPGACDECFTLDSSDGIYTVSGGAPLGVRYGVSALLEAFGWRFYHPAETWCPPEIGAPDTSAFGQQQAPEVDRRGIHLHTLHPIDGLYAFWTGESPDRAFAIADWAVRNRANHLQWVGLDDISGSSSRLAEWQEDTRVVVDHAHAQGLTVGLGIQLFGTSNLQRAFDLVDSPADEATMRASMVERLSGVAEAADWDVLNLSFGEFSGVEPEQFVGAVNLARQVAREEAPNAEMTATIHVGNYEDLRVDYKGEDLLYYFLVKYADPSITPWVHSVMYYNLVEDAGLAYDHEVFDEHRAFLEEKLAAGEPVGYFPETAYWVAFDDSVPAYLPLYIRSRWADLNAFPALEDHVLFSTGWEWGYWQNDVAALRMSWARPADWRDTVDWMFAPVDGALADTVIALAEVEHTWLLEGRLAAWLAGRDDFIDLGDRIDVHSQPDRPSYAEIQAMEPAESARLVGDLDAFAADLTAITPPTGEDGWSREVADGLEVTTLRARYAAALVHAAAEPAFSADQLALADTLLGEARVVVTRRHANLHDSVDGRLTVPGSNPTLYQYGFLRWADELCYWEREYAQASNLLVATDLDVPGCAL